MEPNRRSLRATLIDIHKTLISIQEAALVADLSPKLTNLERAVVILEDRRFFEHVGFDWRSMLREIWRFLSKQKYGGASTIDIQLFRTFSNRYERTLRRKLREIASSFSLQRKLSKIQILRVYLENAYFGTGLIGASAASLEIYEKDVDDLSMEEALFIAAMLVYPKPRVGTVNWEAKTRRRADYGGFLIRTGKERRYQI